MEQAQGYESGTCNIGPDEVAYRRTLGHVGLIVTLGVLIVLIAIHAPLPVRFLVALPAWGTAVAYLQAWLRFCAAFGALGIFNFGSIGSRQRVQNAQLRARDRRRALEIVLLGLLVGVVTGAVAVLLPF